MAGWRWQPDGRKEWGPQSVDQDRFPICVCRWQQMWAQTSKHVRASHWIYSVISARMAVNTMPSAHSSFTLYSPSPACLSQSYQFSFSQIVLHFETVQYIQMIPLFSLDTLKIFYKFMTVFSSILELIIRWEYFTLPFAFEHHWRKEIK